MSPTQTTTTPPATQPPPMVPSLLDPKVRLRRALNAVHWRVRSRESLERWTSRRLGVGVDFRFWLFVLGVNNSGTTLLTETLRLHPAITSLPREGQRLTRALPNPGLERVPRLWTKRLEVFRWIEEDDGRPAARARHDWAAFVPPHPRIILEKSPPNAVRSRWLQRHFAPARFIAITRSPYAVCEGIMRRQKTTAEIAARHWAMANECLLEDRAHLEHCLPLTYEDFCADPAAVLAEVQQFLDLDEPFVAPGDRPLRIHNVTGAPQTLANMNHRSLERLAPDDIRTITEVTGAVMERLGYEPAEPDA
jgi:hypothetical protein